MASYSASNGYLITESDIPLIKGFTPRLFYHGNITLAVEEIEAKRWLVIDGVSFLSYLIANRFTDR